MVITMMMTCHQPTPSSAHLGGIAWMGAYFSMKPLSQTCCPTCSHSTRHSYDILPSSPLCAKQGGKAMVSTLLTFDCDMAISYLLGCNFAKQHLALLGRLLDSSNATSTPPPHRQHPLHGCKGNERCEASPKATICALSKGERKSVTKQPLFLCLCNQAWHEDAHLDLWQRSAEDI